MTTSFSSSNNDKSTKVDCGVVNCKYHGANNCCSANHINVRNSSARESTETFCGTFEATYLK